MRRYLTEHFTLDELTRSDTALRLGIDNSKPPADVLANLGLLAETLERVRTKLGVPIHINSAFRCEKLNAAIGSKPTSAHVQGLAADFTAPDCGSPLVVAQILASSGIEFDQLIQEGAWLHLGISRVHNRRELLTAHFDKGIARYTAGLSISRNTFA